MMVEIDVIRVFEMVLVVALGYFGLHEIHRLLFLSGEYDDDNEPDHG